MTESLWRLHILVAGLALGLPVAAFAQTGPQSVEKEKSGEETAKLETVVVTGSRIARKELEGPAPVTIITGEQLTADGFTTLYETMGSLTQSFPTETPPHWGSTTVNARQIDLRGIGANHTLMLVDGLRVADYPQASHYGQAYNFQNYNNLPAGLVDRVEIVTSGASAIYGSDAVAGVVNVILKHDYNGDDFLVRRGGAQRGARNLWDLQWSGGKSGENWNIEYALQDFQRSALFGRDRPYTESEADAGLGTWTPTDFQYGYQSYVGLGLQDTNGNFLTPPAGACTQSGFGGALRQQYAPAGGNPSPGGSNGGANGTNGYYCAQNAYFKDWVLTPGIISTNGYLYGEYKLADDLKLYTAGGVWRTTGISNTELPFAYPQGGLPLPFYDQTTGTVINNYLRQFYPQELGSQGNTYDREQDWDVHVGLKGTVFGGRLNWDATIGRSVYWVHESYAGLNEQGMFNYLFGQQQGTTTIGGTTYPVYALNPQRFWNPISPSDYASFGVFGENDATSWINQGQLMFTGDLFHLPAGPLGFAGIIETEKQGFLLMPDSRGNTLTFGDPFQDYNTGGGSRTRSAIGTEFRAPLVPTLTATLAGRIDKYNDFRISNEPKTWQAGLEWHPVRELMLRGTYGTTFHAPDLIDIYQQLSTSTVGIYADPYNCIINHINPCNATQHNTYFTHLDGGNPNLQPEIGRSYTYGIVWASDFGLEAKTDYIHLRLANRIQSVDLTTVLNDEAGCRTGQNVDGSPYTAHVPGSAYCQDAITNVVRDANGNIIQVRTGPINEAYTAISAVDSQINYRWNWLGVGGFRFRLDYTLNLHNLSRTKETDPLVENNYNNPYSRITASLNWLRAPWEATLWGQRIGGVRDNGWGSCTGGGSPPCGPGSTVFYGYTSPWMTLNASAGYSFRDKLKLSAYVSNLTNRVGPIPYYAGGFEFIHTNAGQDYVGREWSLQAIYNFH